SVVCGGGARHAPRGPSPRTHSLAHGAVNSPAVHEPVQALVQFVVRGTGPGEIRRHPEAALRGERRRRHGAQRRHTEQASLVTKRVSATRSERSKRRAGMPCTSCRANSRPPACHATDHRPARFGILGGEAETTASLAASCELLSAAGTRYSVPVRSLRNIAI